jgi:hypothetical protein
MVLFILFVFCFVEELFFLEEEEAFAEIFDEFMGSPVIKRRTIHPCVTSTMQFPDAMEVSGRHCSGNVV